MTKYPKRIHVRAFDTYDEFGHELKLDYEREGSMGYVREDQVPKSEHCTTQCEANAFKLMLKKSEDKHAALLSALEEIVEAYDKLIEARKPDNDLSPVLYARELVQTIREGVHVLDQSASELVGKDHE
jgi:hypothetical protein